MELPVYLDYNATTPADPRVVERMLPFFAEHFGNASSRGHAFGWAADEAVEAAREEVAGLIGAAPEALTFTSGATEAANLALRGVAAAYARKGRHLVTVATEHKAVLDTCRALERVGCSVTTLPVDAHGLVDPDDVAAALTEETVLVAIMWANNETGVLQPIPAIAARVRERGALFVTDATQAVGKVPVDARHADILFCSAHKFYGPKGVGALYASRRSPRVRLVPQVTGGGQERGLRGGTLNTPGIVGMGAAAALAGEVLAAEHDRLGALRDGLEARLSDTVSDLRINGGGARRLPNTSSLTLPGVRAADLVARLRDLALSTGSACSTGSNAPSHVLKAMGLSDADARSTIRVSLGRFTTDEQVAFAADRIAEAARALRTAPAVA